MSRNLKALIVKNSMTQEEVSKHLEINLSSFNLKINEKREFTRKEINKILKLFKVQYEEIFFEE